MSTGSSSPLDRNRNEILRELYKATTANSAPPAATEAMQITIAGILQSLLDEENADFEWNMVEDNNGDLFLLRQTLEDDGSILNDYIDADGNVAAPVSPIKFISPNNLLSLILAALSDVATDTTLTSVLTELQNKADLTETQPVSAVSLPLPTGAATETTLATLATEITLAALLTELQAKADLTETQPVSLASIPLAVNAATETKQDTIIAELQNIETTLTGSQRVIDLVESAVDGSTDSGVQNMSIIFRGNGGTLDGVSVPNNFATTYTPNKGEDTIGSISYTVPTSGAEQRVIIRYTR